jgi:adenine deaminase
MGSLNAAECHRIDHLVGSITPGRYADILILNNLEEFEIESVIVNGELIAENGAMRSPISSPEYPNLLYQTLKLDKKLSAEDFYIYVDPQFSRARVLTVNQSLEGPPPRKGIEFELEVKNGRIQTDPNQDVCYITAIERHTGAGERSSAFISGLGLKSGAIATSLSGDNSILVAGASVEDMAAATNHIVDQGGGQVVMNHGEIMAEIALPIAGMLSNISVSEMANLERRLNYAASQLGMTDDRPFFGFSLLTIVEAPDYGMTYKGLVKGEIGDLVDPVIALYS